MKSRNAFPMALRRWRKKRGLSMTAAAAKMKVPYRTWQDWELGYHEPRGLARTAILEKIGK